MTSQKGVCEGRLTVGHLPDYFQKKLMPRGQSRCFFFFFWGGGGGKIGGGDTNGRFKTNYIVCLR